MSQHIVEFLQSMDEREMADEVLLMHNRLEAFSNRLDQDCFDTLRAKVAVLTEQLQAWSDADLTTKVHFEQEQKIGQLTAALGKARDDFRLARESLA